MAIVVIVAGAAAYVGASFANPGAVVRTSCEPAGSSACRAFGLTHDLVLSAPILSAQVGTPIPFTASLPGAEVASNFTFNFGDGSAPFNSRSSTVDHVYSNPGTYLVYAQADVGGSIHDGLGSLAEVQVTPSYTSTAQGRVPGVSAVLLSNSSSSSHPTAVLSPGQSVTVQGSYTTGPIAQGWTAGSPKFIPNGGTISNTTQSALGGSASVSFPRAGVWSVTFVADSTGPGGAGAYQNYTWTVFVAAAGEHAGVHGLSKAEDPHPGTIVAYEQGLGPIYSIDPAIDYYSTEIMADVEQNLITYNGSTVGPNPQYFDPQIATCVPGSAQCQHLYGNTLVQGDNYTFVISHVLQFYDPTTHASWGVYPTDVVFSLARTMGFSDEPCVGCNNGWILTQSLLPTGNGAWDGGMHFQYNNTPQNVFGHMLVNDSRYCPGIAMTQEHGCVTLVANGSGHTWPEFLEFLADPLGSAIVPCGWFSANAQGAGIPDWTRGTVSGSGDQPCTLPGGYTSTNASGYWAHIASIPATAWDNWELVGSGATGTYVGNVTNAAVGSGPYYLASYQLQSGYALLANPSYHGNPDCTWSTCEPAAGAYAPRVEVHWEDTAIPGEQAYAAGISDLSTIPPADTAVLLQLESEGKANAVIGPSLTIQFWPFDQEFNPTATGKYVTNPVNVPGDWFQYLGLRQFLARAYPYSTVQSTIYTRDGILYGFNYGGAIPHFMSDYYPTDIPWPSTDPCASSSNWECPAYWWAQASAASGPYADPELAKCTTSSPCQFPMFAPAGAADVDQTMNLWIRSIETFSGGRILPFSVDLGPGSMSEITSQAPGANAATMYFAGWAPDFPDPTDYVNPLYTPDNFYSYPNAISEGMSGAGWNTTGCSTDYNYYANLTTPVPQSCQGAAYGAMLNVFARAASLPATPYRVLLYDLGERIANQLALYVYDYQYSAVISYAPWVYPSSIDLNPLATAGAQFWYWFQGNNLV
jgi:hypothetical protein